MQPDCAGAKCADLQEGRRYVRMCARVFVSAIVVQRKQQPRPGKKKKSLKTGFLHSGGETMEQEKLNIDPVWCRRQINQVRTEQRWEVEQNGRLKKGGMEAVQ